MKCSAFTGDLQALRELKVLLTAFDIYDEWKLNSSWEAMSELLRVRGVPAGVTTRRYPVDLDQIEERLANDLSRGFDAVLHLGQAPGISGIRMETIAINVAGTTQSAGTAFGPIVTDGPVAFRTRFPLEHWKSALNSASIPNAISYHAGTYLCNAIMYLSHHWHAAHGLERPIGFLHLPLVTEQVIVSGRELPSMSREQSAKAIGIILDLILSSPPPSESLDDLA